ncbi:MAG: flavoprotein, partial [Chitinophagaceae bacterium]
MDYDHKGIPKIMRKILVAATGASGAIYFKVLLDKLLLLKNQWNDLAVVMSDNAREVWATELGNTQYNQYPFTFYNKNDFSAPFASGSGQFDT